MSVTLVLDDEIDISRGDTITAQVRAHGPGLRPTACVGRRFEADVVWMDERPLDPSRLYLLKHTTRTVTVEANRPLALNQIETVTLDDVTAARLRSLPRHPCDRQLHPDRSDDELHGRRRHDHRRDPRRSRRLGAAERRRAAGAHRALGRHRTRRRSPPSQRALEELLK